LSAFLWRLKELIMPRAAGRALCETYGGKITANKKRGARASVFLKISTGGGRRITGGGSRAAGHETRPAGVGTRAAGVVGSLLISGQKRRKTAKNPKKKQRCPRALAAQARAMFFTNNHVKNDMSVSRETLPIFCAVVGGLLTA
jgi:hypothetical protein